MRKIYSIAFAFVFISLLNFYGFGQEITNVNVTQEGATTLIAYDLTGQQAKYHINVFYSIDEGKTWQGPLKHVTGDVTDQMPGTNKKIYWNAAIEKGRIEGYIQFMLYAVLLDSELKEASVEKPVYSDQYYKYKKGKNVWLTGALISGAAGVFSYIQANKYYDQYQTATTDAANLHQKVKLYDQITPVAFGVAGFCALEFILKAGKQAKEKKQSLTFAPVPVKNGAGIGLAYTF